jgi:hypothetical protein
MTACHAPWQVLMLVLSPAHGWPEALTQHGGAMKVFLEWHVTLHLLILPFRAFC